MPGLGYWLIGQRQRGVIAGSVILATFLLGLLIGGIRVIDVPGYDASGEKRMTKPRQQGEWRLKTEFVPEVMNKPWYIAQSLAGPINIAATWVSLDQADKKVAMSTSRIFDIGTLYTAVAGMLNLLVIIDASYRATHPRKIESPATESSTTPASGSAGAA